MKNKCALPECQNIRTSKKSFPFCSETCRMVDLYNWFSGEYVIDEEPPLSFDEGRDEPEKFWRN